MIPHQVTEDRYVPARWQRPRHTVTILAVTTGWRGSFDTFHLALHSLQEMERIRVYTIDWRIDPWIFAIDRPIVRFAVLDDIARSFQAELVVLLGGNLSLDEAVPESHDRTYVTYQISSVADLSEICLQAFLNCHFRYMAHSLAIQMLHGKATWLPIGTASRFIARACATVEFPPSNVLLPWNNTVPSRCAMRSGVIRELSENGIEFSLYGSGWTSEIRSLNAFELLGAMRNAKLVIDDNHDPFVPASRHLNDRLMAAANCGAAVLTCDCLDVRRCFHPDTEFIKCNQSSGLAAGIRHASLLDRERLEEIGRAAQRRVFKDHDWSTRWAQILHDHFSRLT